MKVNYDEMVRILDALDVVNKCPLTDIEWVKDDGTKIEVHPEIIEDFKFVGMSNTSFLETYLGAIVAGDHDKLLADVRETQKAWVEMGAKQGGWEGHPCSISKIVGPKGTRPPDVNTKGQLATGL